MNDERESEKPEDLVQQHAAIAEDPFDNVPIELDYPIYSLLIVFSKRTQLFL